MLGRKKMQELSIVKSNGGSYIDSREVAELVGKRHHHLLRDIDKYKKIMQDSIETKIGFNEFFIESVYSDAIGRTLPCYLLTKMGCDNEQRTLMQSGYSFFQEKHLQNVVAYIKRPDVRAVH
jgi:phage regulator Rha-like protein